MRLLFWNREAPASVTPDPAPPSSPALVTPEELIDNPKWAFTPSHTGTGTTFSHQDILAASAIYSARQMRRIADDVEAIRKHMTRLQLVTPPAPDESETP